MWPFVFILLGLGSGFLIILIFGLMKAGKRADEGEDKIIDCMSLTLSLPKNTHRDKTKILNIPPNLAKSKFKASMENKAQ